MRVPASVHESKRSTHTVLRKKKTYQASSEVRDAVLITNPSAGGGRRMHQLDEARHILRKAGIETELQLTCAPGEATAMARRAVEQSRQLAIVCGGDGTVNEAVNGLACSQVPLAVLPSGTANVLAKELSIPWNLAGAGPDGAIVAAVRPEIKLRAGIIAYWQEGFKQLTRYTFPRFRVTTGDHSIDTTLVIVGRTKHYGGPFKITTEADLLRPEF